MHGRGLYTWPDGRKYEGQYIEDKKEGEGEYIWVNFSLSQSLLDRYFRGFNPSFPFLLFGFLFGFISLLASKDHKTETQLPLRLYQKL